MRIPRRRPRAAPHACGAGCPNGALEGLRDPDHEGRKASKATRGVDAAARRAIAGGPTADDASMGAESPELRTLREAERELFPPAAPGTGQRVAVESSSRAARRQPSGDRGVGGAARATDGHVARVPDESAQDLAWLEHLEMPDLPVRWDERVVRYLEFFRDDPRGHATFANLYRHSGRWRDMMRRALRRKSLPTDLVWVSMIESGFDATAHSTAGAAGLWQLMPETAKIYGLAFDRWLDQRMSATLATDAAADMLGDLHRRFGGWELALAGFNMGYAGLASVLKRFNTNDFWSLSRTEGALPWETTLYVPKVFAAAVVAHNLAAFGFARPRRRSSRGDRRGQRPAGDAARPRGAGGRLHDQGPGDAQPRASSVAHSARCGRGRDAPAPVNVPQGKGAVAAQALLRLRTGSAAARSLRRALRRDARSDRGGAQDDDAEARRAQRDRAGRGRARGNGASRAARRGRPPTETPTATGPKPAVIVPSDVFVYPDRKRVFYRVLVGDTLKEIGSALRVIARRARRDGTASTRARASRRG